MIAVKALWRSAIFRAVIGASLGMLVGLLLCQGWGGSPLSTVLPNGAYGGLVMGTTVAYDIERWSLTRSTLCHLLITLGGFCALGLAQGWLAGVPWWLAVAFVAAYFLIWLAQWIICCRRVRSMNSLLRRRHFRGA